MRLGHVAPARPRSAPARSGAPDLDVAAGIEATVCERHHRQSCLFVPICLVCAGVRRARRMSFLLTCPNCGEREVTDFAYGGEVVPRPTTKPSERELNAYNYFRRNVAGVQREWWYHRSGCRAWFLAERDTTTNEVRWVGPAGSDEPPPPRPRRADRPRADRLVQLRRQAGRGVRGRHDRLGAARRRPPGALAQLQVPPPARAALLRRPVPELPRRRRRLARRARLHRAGARGDEGRAHEREAVAATST